MTGVPDERETPTETAIDYQEFLKEQSAVTVHSEYCTAKILAPNRFFICNQCQGNPNEFPRIFGILDPKFPPLTYGDITLTNEHFEILLSSESKRAWLTTNVCFLL